jgi:phage terminase large subunit-like protein
MQADIEHIRHLQREENYRFNIEEVGGSTPKVDRIRRLIAWFEQGRIWLPRVMAYRDYEGIARDLVSSFIEDEYVAFPVAVHDDMLDALARLLEPDLALLWPIGEREPKETKEDRYLKRWREQQSANASAWAA